MSASNDLLERSINRFALAMALAVAIVIPLGYWLVAQQNYSASLDFKAKVKAAALSGSIASNPDTWMFAENRMHGLLQREPVPLDDEQVQVFTADDEIVAKVGRLPPGPLLKRTYPLYDSGRSAGRIVIAGSLRPMLWNALIAAVLGLLFGGIVYAVMKTLPLGALRAATAALSASELRFRSIFENVPNIAVRGYDADLRIIFWNPASERLYGYAAAEAIGQRVDVLIYPPLAAPGLVAAFAAWRAGGTAVPAGELVLQRKDGSPVTVYTSHTMVANATGQLETYSIDVELTELKRTEAELRSYQTHLEDMVKERTLALSIAKEAAEAASRAKSSFLANMSHELRTPMNAVMGMLALARRRMSDPHGLQQLDNARIGADHLLAVINNILDISKIEAERFTLEETDFVLGAVLGNVDNLVGQRAAEKGLTLRIEPSPGLDERSFRGDPLRLGQILLNLAGNAVKFSDRGSVILRVSQVEETADGVLLRFEVEDKGIGISADEKKRLFAAFEQADGSMTRKYGGTGLGLAISKQLARMMGGEIGVDSTPGVGSTFWFTVRMGRSAVTAPAPAVSRAAASTDDIKRLLAGAAILLAEDEPASREITATLLSEAGVEVEQANDGAEALHRARSRHYDLILMDIQMTGLTGIEATLAIRVESMNMATPILALTANAFTEDRMLCIDAGMNDHIVKPCDPDRLLATLAHWLDDAGARTAETTASRPGA